MQEPNLAPEPEPLADFLARFAAMDSGGNEPPNGSGVTINTAAVDSSIDLCVGVLQANGSCS
eukprot:4383499-Karenia_brevis.AAC.1